MHSLEDEAPRGVSQTGNAQCLSSPPQVTRREILLASGGVAACASMPPASGAAVEQQGCAVRVLRVHLTINGKPLDLHIDARQSLLDVLRETLGLMGTKKGCNQGACGACTVLLDGRRVNACLTLAVMHDGADVKTIEGLASNEELHPLQAAFIAHEGFQCGYCTAGQIMSGIGCIAEGHADSVEEVRAWMSGNICRCGAYPGVVAAILDVAGRT
jgi:xanthine dehydrogenase YagT iron-sulfur-binding subunit